MSDSVEPVVQTPVTKSTGVTAPNTAQSTNGLVYSGADSTTEARQLVGQISSQGESNPITNDSPIMDLVRKNPELFHVKNSAEGTHIITGVYVEHPDGSHWIGSDVKGHGLNGSTPAPVTNVATIATNKGSTIEPVQQSKKEFDDIVSSYPSESTSISASKLADDTSNDLTDNQRTTLRKLSDAIVVANRTKTLNDVSNDVIQGSKGYRGLNQYISSMMNAVRSGKKSIQAALVSDINSFNEDHAQKAQLVRQAISIAPKGMAQEVLRTPSGWELGKQIPVSQAMSKKYQAQMKASGSLVIHSGSEGVVRKIEEESSAVSVTADALKAIYESQSSCKVF